MACTPGGEARVLPPPSGSRFSAFFFLPPLSFSLCHLLVALSFSFASSRSPPFSLPPGAGKGEGFAKLLDHLGRQRSRRARSVAFSRNLPIGPRTHGSFICILRFFEVKLTRRLPLPTTTSCRSFSLPYEQDLPRLAPTGFWAAARPTDPENRPCEISRSMEIDARSPIDRRRSVIKEA